MSTNYYWSSAPCETCGLSETRRLHIGKSSGGYAFGLRVYPERGLNELDDWSRLWNTSPVGVITNEYGETITPAEMMATVSERGDVNHRRGGKDGYLVIKRGAGTYDLMDGEFC